MTREDAERFLQGLDTLLHWESHEGIPDPPIERVELVRQFLNNVWFPVDRSQHTLLGCKWLSYWGTDQLIQQAWKRARRPRYKNDLYPIFEEIYLNRWRRAWQFSKSPSASENLREHVLKALRTTTKMSHINFSDSDKLRDHLDVKQGHAFGLLLDSNLVGTDSRSQILPLFLLYLFGGVVSVYLQMTKNHSWLVLIFLFFTLVLGNLSICKTYHHNVWGKPDLTFGELLSALQLQAQHDHNCLVWDAQYL